MQQPSVTPDFFTSSAILDVISISSVLADVFTERIMMALHQEAFSIKKALRGQQSLFGSSIGLDFDD